MTGSGHIVKSSRIRHQTFFLYDLLFKHTTHNHSIFSSTVYDIKLQLK